MALVDRAKNITLKPAAEWPVIALEPTSIGALYSGYIIPLALIGPICALASQALFFHHLIIGLVLGALSFVLELVGIFVVALIADALAPSFNGIKDGTQSLKWVAYANTPRWIAGVLQLIPVLGSLIVLVASLYGLYVLYLGAIPMMRVPSEKSALYTVVVVVCSIVFYVVVGGIIGVVVASMTAAAMIGSGAFAH